MKNKLKRVLGVIFFNYKRRDLGVRKRSVLPLHRPATTITGFLTPFTLAMSREKNKNKAKKEKKEAFGIQLRTFHRRPCCIHIPTTGVYILPKGDFHF